MFIELNRVSSNPYQSLKTMKTLDTQSQATKQNNQIDANKLTNLALECLNEGQTEKALDFAQNSVDISKEHDLGHFILGVIYARLGKFGEAEQHYKLAISYNSSHIDYYYNYALTLKAMGKLLECLEQLKNTLLIEPNNIICLNELGLLYLNLGNQNKAKENLFRAYELDKLHIPTLVNISFFCLKNNLLNEAISFAEQIIKINPDSSEPYFTIAYALSLANFFEEAIEYTHLSISKSEVNSADKYHYLLMNYLYIDKYSPEKIFKEHQNWARKYLKYKSYIPNTQKNPQKKLKIGFISSDFMKHSISSFFLPLVENYDKDGFEFYCFSGVTQQDEVSEKINISVDQWFDIYQLSTDETCQLIQQENIDILIDLAGHSKGNFLSVLCEKPAPVQFTYLGYPFSTGLENIDYRISDEYADPMGLTEHLHSETIVRMKPSFLCYQPIDKDVAISETIPFDNNNYVSFGSFNNLQKMSSTTIALWSKILHRVENSILVLKSSQDMPDLLMENIVAQFQINGINLERLRFYDRTVHISDHLNLYNGIDIGLDTFPYNGTTTTFEALWMGVPVISLCGNDHRSRVGNSILQNLNLPNLVAKSAEEWVEKTVKLANDHDLIRKYRRSLRDELMYSTLTDTKQFSKSFSHVLRESWKKYCSSLS